MLVIIRPDLYEYHALPMTDELFWRRIENLRRAALTAEDFEFRLLYYNQMVELMKRCPLSISLLIEILFKYLKIIFVGTFHLLGGKD